MRKSSFLFASALLGALAFGEPAFSEPIPGSDLPGFSEAAPQAKEMANAIARFRSGEREEGLRQIRQIVEKDADLPPAEVIAAQLYFQEGMPQEGKAALESATKVLPDDPEAFLLLAGIAAREGDAAEAGRLYEKTASLLAAFDKSAKRKQVMEVQCQFGLAGLARARKDWPAAEKHLANILQTDPNNPAATMQLAQCFFDRKDVDGAFRLLREAAKSNPGMNPAEAFLARLFFQAGDRANAVKWLDDAMAAAPKDVRLRLMAGQWALESARVDDAVKHAIAAVRIDPKSPEAQFFRGVMALFQKDFVTAESYLEMAAKQSPDNFGVTNNLVLALIELDDEAKREKALQLAAKNWRAHPESAEANATYGWALYRLGKRDEAEKPLAAAAKLESDNGDLDYYQARLAVDRGRKDEARRLLESAMKTTKPFLYRQEAEELLRQLKK